MIKYELLPTLPLTQDTATLQSQSLPELVHMDDPALAVMTDFTQSKPHTISPDETMDNALNEMKVHGVHLLLVVDNQHHIIGFIASEDLLGEKPIMLIQERRIKREQILVKMLMLPIDNITAFSLDDVQHARVGNIVNTLKSLNTHYALVVHNNAETKPGHVRGLFSTSQISKQLHEDIAGSIAKAQTVSELHKRHN